MALFDRFFKDKGALSKKNQDLAIYSGAALLAATILVLTPKIFVVACLLMALVYLFNNQKQIENQLGGLLSK